MPEPQATGVPDGWQVVTRPATPTAPETFWTKHPDVAAVARGALDTLPVIGGTIGGMAATPETLGIGAPAGVVLGAGVGKGARDLAAHALGLDPSSPTDKAVGIAHAMEGTAAMSALFSAAPLLKVPTGKLLQFAGKTLKSPTTPVKMAGSWLESIGNDMAAPPKVAASVAAPPAAPNAAPAPSAAPEAAPPAPGMNLAQQVQTLQKVPKLTAAEFAEGSKWLQQGTSEADVMERISAARAFNAKFGGQLPTSQEVKSFVAKRNETGKWE